MTDEYGSGLQIFLRTQANKITGILNGLDTHKWDPGTDAELAANFTITNLQARRDNKSFLQRRFDLVEDPSIPLLAMVTRMDPQRCGPGSGFAFLLKITGK
jgi:starch synthase